MGQHKHNPTAIAAAKGELPPKKRAPHLTKWQAERILKAAIWSSFFYCPGYGAKMDGGGNDEKSV